MKTKYKIMIVIGVYILTAISCSKFDSKGQLSVMMTDAPANYNAVLVEVLQVEMHHETQGWIALPTQSGVYDLLQLQNDVLANLVTEADVPIGKITQVRLILGVNNHLVAGIDTIPLTIPSGDETGLKLNVNTEIRSSTSATITLDFKAGESIQEKGDGSVSLKPVLVIKEIKK